MIKYIFFDWGYTLIEKFKNVDNEINKIVSKYGVTWMQVFPIWRNYHYLHSLGRIINNQEKYEQISKLTNIAVVDLEKIGSLLLDSHIFDQVTIDTLNYLYNKGYKLGIISNNIDEDVKYVLQREKIQELFDVIVCSSVSGVRKPAAKIFLDAYKNINKEDYQKILFVSDELSEDIVGSMALGTKTAWLKSNVVNEWRNEEPEIFKVDYVINKISDLQKLL